VTLPDDCSPCCRSRSGPRDQSRRCRDVGARGQDVAVLRAAQAERQHGAFSRKQIESQIRGKRAPNLGDSARVFVHRWRRPREARGNATEGLFAEPRPVKLWCCIFAQTAVGIGKSLQNCGATAPPGWPTSKKKSPPRPFRALPRTRGHNPVLTRRRCREDSVTILRNAVEPSAGQTAIGIAPASVEPRPGSVKMPDPKDDPKSSDWRPYIFARD
jgi:hypothetical protein